MVAFSIQLMRVRVGAMAVRTRKYVIAVETAKGLNLLIPETAEALYTALNHRNFFWDREENRWVPGSEPDEPTDRIRIRVWAESSKVSEVANNLIRRMTQAGYVLTEKSEPYLCRPPKQAESRIYLTFREEA
jgi:hypothetical protein